jgi:hypothetical protein
MTGQPLRVKEVFLVMTLPGFSVPPVAPFSSETDTLEFLTGDSWSAYDLAAAMRALDEIYSSFLLTRHLAVIANRRTQAIAQELDRYWHALEREGPHFEMLAYEWSRIIRRLGPGAAPFPFPFAPMGGGFQNQISATSDTELDYYLSHSDEYMPPSDELVVAKIEMASPGRFSLRGLGEPIRELRELIKDLWYRNRQERERGDLELLQQKMAVLSQNNLPPPQVQVLAISVAAENEDLKRLIENGKLTLAGEEPKKLEKPKTTRQRKPRKRRPSEESSS